MYRNTESDYGLLIGNASDNSGEKAADLSDWLDSIRAENKDQLLANPEIHELSPELNEFVNEALLLYKEEYTKLGISLPEQRIKVVEGTNKFFTDIQKDKGLENYSGFIRGYVDKNSGTVIINDLHEKELILHEDEVAARELNLRYKALIIAHELYHRFAPILFTSERNSSNEIVIKDWRQGLEYGSDYSKGVRMFSLEEGLAEIWTQKFRDLADKNFPYGAVLNANILKDVNDENITDVSSYDSITGTAYLEETRYPNSKKLVEFISTKVPNFYIIAEEARLNGKIDELASEIEDVFGVGSFSIIVAADETNAEELIEKLSKTIKE